MGVQYQDFSLPETRYFRSSERKYRGTFAPRSSRELSLLDRPSQFAFAPAVYSAVLGDNKFIDTFPQKRNTNILAITLKQLTIFHQI